MKMIQPTHSIRRVFISFVSWCEIAVAVIAILLASETEARAYTDPGSGAMIWQLLVASFFGAAFYFRRFTSWLRRRKDLNN